MLVKSDDLLIQYAKWNPSAKCPRGLRAVCLCESVGVLSLLANRGAAPMLWNAKIRSNDRNDGSPVNPVPRNCFELVARARASRNGLSTELYQLPRKNSCFFLRIKLAKSGGSENKCKRENVVGRARQRGVRSYQPGTTQNQRHAELVRCSEKV